ncbi:MAG: hypothetical protein ACQEP9_01880 [Bacillota bacterium]
MKLTTYLKEVTETRIKKIATRHRIYYNSDFSRNWLNNQIKNKLLDSQYLKNLTANKLSQTSQQILKKLSTTESINKDSINLNSYHNLLQHGLIYERNNFCYLFSELKPLLQNLFTKEDNKNKGNKTKQSKKDTESKIKKFNLGEVTTQQQINLSLFHYLILSLAKIEVTARQDHDQTIEELISLLKKINTSNLSATKLLNKILQYSQQHNLLTTDFTISQNFYSWLKTSRQEKILTAITTFMPHSATEIRKIIAVLSNYPQNEHIPLKFAYQELNLKKFSSEDRQLFGLLNTIKINNKKLYLTKQAWQYFNPQTSFNFSQASLKKEKIFVPPTVKLADLWEVATNNQLIAIKEQLVFKKISKPQNK